jgi:hypothetical protein
MKRVALAVLVLVSAGCAALARNPRVEWVEPRAQVPLRPGGEKVFLFHRDWYVGRCWLQGGSHVTIKPDGRVYFMLSLSGTEPGAQWRYGATLLAADGTMLTHLPSPRGGVYVADAPVVRNPQYPSVTHVMRGTEARVTRQVFERVARVAMHVNC